MNSGYTNQQDDPNTAGTSDQIRGVFGDSTAFDNNQTNTNRE